MLRTSIETINASREIKKGLPIDLAKEKVGLIMKSFFRISIEPESGKATKLSFGVKFTITALALAGMGTFPAAYAEDESTPLTRSIVVTGCQNREENITDVAQVEAYCAQIPTPRTCYRTRLDHQLANAKLCESLHKQLHPEDGDELSHEDVKDLAVTAEETDAARFPTDRRCAYDAKLDADGSHDGKDGNDDDDKAHGYDDGYGKLVSLVDDQLASTQAPSYPKSDDMPGIGDAGHEKDPNNPAWNLTCNDDAAQGCTQYHSEPGVGKKAIICHVPPGNPANAQTLTVSQNSLRRGHMMPESGESKDLRERHRLHNQDYFGPCTKTAATPAPIPVFKPIVIPKSKIAMVIKEYRECIDPGKGGGSKTIVETALSSGSTVSGDKDATKDGASSSGDKDSHSGSPSDLSGAGGRGNWRELVH